VLFSSDESDHLEVRMRVRRTASRDSRCLRYLVMQPTALTGEHLLPVRTDLSGRRDVPIKGLASYPLTPYRVR
jgi:hypothetical protein